MDSQLGPTTTSDVCYPSPREKCAAPSCTNAYKYRDSPAKLPLCSLECYKAMKAVRSYYASVSGYMDELLWAVLWLHRATGREEYLAYAVDIADGFSGISWAITEFSWDAKYAVIQILAAECYPKKEVCIGEPKGCKCPEGFKGNGNTCEEIFNQLKRSFGKKRKKDFSDV